MKLLKQLTESYYVGGEGTAKNVINEYLPALCNKGGSLCCTFGKGKKIMLDAHIDQIAMIITEIKGSFVSVSKCGGIDPRTLVGKEVVLHGKQEVNGVFTSIPPHLAKEKEASPKLEELYIDCGDVEAEKVLSLGDFVTFKGEYVPLCESRVSATSLDNRAGVTAVMLAGEQLKDVNAQICLNFSNGEELGLRGAKTSAYDFYPEIALVVDVSFADGAGVSDRHCKSLSKGPMIGISPILDKELTNFLISTAQAFGINYQLEVMGGATGTNADVISLTKGGVKTVLVSIPIRNMHSPVEVCDLEDIKNTATLIAEFVKGVCRNA